MDEIVPGEVITVESYIPNQGYVVIWSDFVLRDPNTGWSSEPKRCKLLLTRGQAEVLARRIMELSE